MDTSLESLQSSLKWLNDKERDLKQQVTRVGLIGELSLTQEGTDELGRRLGEWARTSPTSAERSRRLMTKCPACTAVFLVGAGLHCYQEGTYWAGVEERLGKVDTSILGQRFLAFLENNDLATFDQEVGHKYVMPILCHAGIPVHCLEKFFDELHLWERDGISSADEWAQRLRREPTRAGRMDKPAERFLRHGGSARDEYVERCQELIGAHAENGTPADVASQYGLPEHVVHAFRKWDALRDRPGGARGRGQARRPQPFIMVEPWDDGVVVVLPAQPCGEAAKPPPAIWRVAVDGSPVASLPAHVLRTASRWETDELSWPVPEPCAAVTVALVVNGTELLSKQIPVLDSKLGTMAFGGDTYRWVDCTLSVPGHELWLLYQRDRGPLHVAEGGTRLEEAPPLPGGWAASTLERWDLAAVSQICLGSCVIRIDKVDRQDFRLEGAPVPHVSTVAGCPVYDTVPGLRVPIAPGSTAESTLARCRLTVTASGRRLGTYQLSELVHSVGDQGREVHIDLAKTGTIDDTTVGAYTLRVRGALGQRVDFTVDFAVVPGLRVRGAGDVRWPGLDGVLPPGQAVAETPLDLVVEPAAMGVDVRADGPGTHCITATPEDGTARIQVKRGNGKPLDLVLSLPYVQWLLEDRSGQQEAAEWTHRAIDRPVAWLEQARSPILRVRGAWGGQTGGWARLRLSGSGEDSQVQYFARSAHRERWVDLTAFRDTVRQSSSSALAIALELGPTAVGAAMEPVPVLQFTRAWEVRNLKASSERLHGGWRLAVHWSAGPRLRHREVRLWALWRPWQDPVVRCLSADAIDGAALELPAADVPAGPYRLELVVSDPWNPLPRRVPAAQASNTVGVRFGSQDQWERHLEHLPDTVVGCAERCAASAGWQRGRPAAEQSGEAMSGLAVAEVLDLLLNLARVAEPWQAPESSACRAVWEFATKCLLQHVPQLVKVLAVLATTATADERQRLHEILVRSGALEVAPVAGGQAAPCDPAEWKALGSAWPVLATALAAALTGPSGTGIERSHQPHRIAGANDARVAGPTRPPTRAAAGRNVTGSPSPLPIVALQTAVVDSPGEDWEVTDKQKQRATKALLDFGRLEGAPRQVAEHFSRQGLNGEGVDRNAVVGAIALAARCLAHGYQPAHWTPAHTDGVREDALVVAEHDPGWLAADIWFTEARLATPDLVE